MATPMFRDLSRALEAPEEGRELWSGIPADEEPTYAEEMFRKASDAALARENALPKTGYVPAGVGPIVEPSMESPLAPLPSGLRSRKPVEFTPDTAKMQGKLAGVLGGNQLLRGPEYGRPLSDEEFASEQERARKLMAQDNASFARDIPVASAEGSKTLASTVPGSGGDDDVRNLYLARLIAQNAAGFGGMGAGKNIDMGIADTLGERMKQIEALRAKRQERQEGLDIERSQNNQTLEYYKRLFPDKAEDLEASLRDATGKGQVFRQGLDAWLKREELQNVKRPTADARIASMGVGDQVKLDTLDLKRDIAKDNEKYRAVQAGLRQAELDLRRAENARKAVGAAEPSTKERGAFQTMMKPAEQTAVALRDADTLNSLGEGMLVTGQPPAFLSRADIAAFNGVPFGQASRSQLAQSNPQAYDLLTKMAEIKTIIGHEYFGSALSPSEAERQRQFMDFSALDSPESLAKKMKNYHDTLSNKATVFLRPRVVNSPLGAEWLQSTGLDALSGEGGTFAGLLGTPKAAAPKAAEVKEPAVVEGKVRMLSPDNRVAKIPAAEVEARKAQGWKEAP